METEISIAKRTGLDALELKQQLGLVSCSTEHRPVSADDIRNLRRKSVEDVAGNYFGYLKKAMKMNGSPVFDVLRAEMQNSPTGPNKKQPRFQSTKAVEAAAKDVLIGALLDAKGLSGVDRSFKQTYSSGLQTAATQLFRARYSQEQVALGIQAAFDAGVDDNTASELRRSEYVSNRQRQIFDTALGTFPEQYIITASEELRRRR